MTLLWEELFIMKENITIAQQNYDNEYKKEKIKRRKFLRELKNPGSTTRRNTRPPFRLSRSPYNAGIGGSADIMWKKLREKRI